LNILLGRTICRKAERSMVRLLKEGDIDEDVFVYINRLSDYLFMLARICAQMEGKPETIYKKQRKSSKDN
jgi:cob(I)alamin adenosyltransferase